MPKKKILVVDDDPDIQALAEAHLKAAGYEVVLAHDGVAALSAAQRERPDLIVLDLGLPAGDGFTVLKRLKNLTTLAKIPVLVVTARDPESCRDEVFASDAAGYLPKPIQKESFLAAVQECFGEKEAPDAAPSMCCPSCGHNFDDLTPEAVESIAGEVTRSVLRHILPT